MLWFFRYIGGFLTVVFYGEFPQKILNISAQNGIFLWNTHLVKNGITACLSVNDFKNLPLAIRKSGVRVHIIKKHGLPFKIRKNRKRTGIYLGLLICAVFLKIISGYIWIIDITGNETVKAEEILTALNQIGIHEGVKSAKINSKNQREKLLLKLDSLAWASLNVEGCRLTVNVTEIKKTEKELHKPSNLKATSDGIIKKIDITSGNCLVKKGDAVKKGDILVSGIVETANRTEFVRSSGVITALTEHNINLNGNFKEETIFETGKVKNKYVLELFTLKIPLYLGKETKECTTTLETRTLRLLGQNIPIKIYKKEFRFTEKGVLQWDGEKLKEKLTEQLNKQIKESKWQNTQIKATEFSENEKGITLSAIVTAEENIVYSEDIILSQENQIQQNPSN